MIDPTPDDFAELRKIVAEPFEVDLDAGRRFGQALVAHHDAGGETLGEWWEETDFIFGMIDGLASDEIRCDFRRKDKPFEPFIVSIVGTDLQNEVRDAVYKALRPFMNPPVVEPEGDE